MERLRPIHKYNTNTNIYSIVVCVYISTILDYINNTVLLLDYTIVSIVLLLYYSISMVVYTVYGGI